MKPYERLKAVFNTPDKVERLRRRFGFSEGHLYKWLRDSEGTTATGHPSPLERVHDIIDEALIVDRTGAGARLIASDALDYLNSLSGESADFNITTEANDLLTKTAAVVCQVNVNDLRRMKREKLHELVDNCNSIVAAAERIRALGNAELRREGDARLRQAG